MADLRFPTALQLMLSLALAEREGLPSLSSTQLAQGLATNPSFVRRVLGLLTQAGLVTSSPGKGGGTRLARDAGNIDLSEVYQASAAGRKLFDMRSDVPHQCLVTRNIESLLDRLDEELNLAMREKLAGRSLAECLVELGRDEAM